MTAPVQRTLWQGRRAVGGGVLAAATTAALFYFGNGLNPLWPLIWLAAVPVLFFSLRAGVIAAGTAAFAAMLAGSLNLLPYFLMLRLPLPVWLVAFGGLAWAFALCVLLFRRLALASNIWLATLSFPAAWVTVEYFTSLLSRHGTAGNLAYSQLNCLPLLQLASLTGLWGISFFLLFVSAWLALLMHTAGGRSPDAARLAATGIAVMAAVIGFGVARLAEPVSGPVVPAGMVASDPPTSPEVAAPGAETSALLTSYAAQVRELAARGAQVVVLPEKIGVVAGGGLTARPEASAADAQYQALADSARVMVVVGEIRVEDDSLRYNQARVFQPGAAPAAYDKEHLLPPFESALTPGRLLVALALRGAKFGVAVCKDMDFTSPARRYGAADVGAMLVPAWDFDTDAFWHGHIAVMRGVENGYSVVRSAKQGELFASDSRGRVLGDVRSNSAPFASLLVSVPAAHVPTLYSALRDWFAWLCVLVSAASVLFAFRRVPHTALAVARLSRLGPGRAVES